MTDREKFITLIRLRDMMYFGVQPTVRQCGYGPEVLQDLAKQGLIRVADRKCGDALDRYVIEGILPAGNSFITEQKALRFRSRH